MNSDTRQSMQHAVLGLHQATAPETGDAWCHFFRECRRAAQELRQRRAASQSATEGMPEAIEVEKCA